MLIVKHLALLVLPPGRPRNQQVPKNGGEVWTLYGLEMNR